MIGLENSNDRFISILSHFKVDEHQGRSTCYHPKLRNKRNWPKGQTKALLCLDGSPRDYPDKNFHKLEVFRQ